MKHSSKYYYIESKGKDKISIIGHSKDEKTGEIYYKFLDKKKALSLVEAERLISPEYKYRVCTITETIETPNFS